MSENRENLNSASGSTYQPRMISSLNDEGISSLTSSMNTDMINSATSRILDQEALISPTDSIVEFTEDILYSRDEQTESQSNQYEQKRPVTYVSQVSYVLKHDGKSSQLNEADTQQPEAEKVKYVTQTSYDVYVPKTGEIKKEVKSDGRSVQPLDESSSRFFSQFSTPLITTNESGTTSNTTFDELNKNSQNLVASLISKTDAHKYEPLQNSTISDVYQFTYSSQPPTTINTIATPITNTFTALPVLTSTTNTSEVPLVAATSTAEQSSKPPTTVFQSLKSVAATTPEKSTLDEVAKASTSKTSITIPISSDDTTVAQPVTRPIALTIQPSKTDKIEKQHQAISDKITEQPSDPSQREPVKYVSQLSLSLKSPKSVTTPSSPVKITVGKPNLIQNVTADPITNFKNKNEQVQTQLSQISELFQPAVGKSASFDKMVESTPTSATVPQPINYQPIYFNTEQAASTYSNVFESLNYNQFKTDVEQFQTFSSIPAAQAPFTSQISDPLLSSGYSKIEDSILRASNPFEIDETELITINGQTGIWSNKRETENWRGIIPITDYQINEDLEPEVIRKRTDQTLVYDQEIAIRYLRPPTPPPPGDIIIRVEKNIPTEPAPPLIIRQQPPRPETPPPLIFREVPPIPPASIGPKIITISGRGLPPPPRKVVIERLPPIPAKPPAIIIERWLPYVERKRKVILMKSNEPDPIIPKPKNVIIEWEPPTVRIRREYKHLGVVRANPIDYIKQYNTSLIPSHELPPIAKEINPPTGITLASDFIPPSTFELEGDIQALTLIDLDREGLSEYKTYIKQTNDNFNTVNQSNIFNTERHPDNVPTKIPNPLLNFNQVSDFSYTTSNIVQPQQQNVFNFSEPITQIYPPQYNQITTTTTTQPLYNPTQISQPSYSLNNNFIPYSNQSDNIFKYIVPFETTSTIHSQSSSIDSVLADLFVTTDKNNDDNLTLEEAEKFILKLNNRLGRIYDEKDARDFVNALDMNKTGRLEFNQFKRAVIRKFS